MVIGDVRGKGLEAVRLAASALGAFREGVHREADLQRVAAAIHEAVRRDAGPEDFITAVLVEVRGEVVQMLGCGHPHPLRLRAGAVSELRLPEALPLGLGPPGPPVLVDVRPGDRVLLFTDGAVEARRAGRFFPLHDAVRDTLAAGDLDAAVEALSRQVLEFTERGAEDDVALLVFELPAVPSPAVVPR
jgi:serine phosphatase RsbU (regulator of sigma subunit)